MDMLIHRRPPDAERHIQVNRVGLCCFHAAECRGEMDSCRDAVDCVRDDVRLPKIADDHLYLRYR